MPIWLCVVLWFVIVVINATSMAYLNVGVPFCLLEGFFVGLISALVLFALSDEF